jgi:hypothetical protein
VGCHVPGSIVETPHGIIFVGSDLALRILPAEGGPSRVIPTSVPEHFKMLLSDVIAGTTWASFDATNGLYYLFLQIQDSASILPVVVNIETGAWGFLDYTGTLPTAGLGFRGTRSAYVQNEGLFFVNSNGTVYSTSSKLATDSGSVCTATWQSPALASDLARGHKQVTGVDVDYKATNSAPATVTVRISGDGGRTFDAARVMSLTSSEYGQARADVYHGGGAPTVEMTSTSTGFELHRLDVSMNLGGRI